MLALSADVFNSAYVIFGYYKSFPHFAGITYAFPFLYGPIFFIYAKLLSSKPDKFEIKSLLHFIPFLLVVLYGFLFVYLKSSEFKISLFGGGSENVLPGLGLISYLKPVHGMLYVFLTINVVKIYNEKIRNSYSNIERINLNWLRYLTTGLSIVWGIVVISYIINEISANFIEMDFLIYTSASILIYSIGYFSLRQPQIFERIQKPNSEVLTGSVVKPVEAASYQKSGLTESDAQFYLKNLLMLMDAEKPYLNSELTIRELADKLSLSTHNLSEILNTRLNQKFYDFINRYRVEEVKRRLSVNNSQKYSLISIAFDSGFNSKSTFNIMFKKFTGMTPSDYRNRLSEKSDSRS